MKKTREKRKTSRRTPPVRIGEEDLRATAGGSVGLSYGKISVEYKPQKPDGNLDVASGWVLTSNKST